jgi:hypothetical protein
MASYDSWFGLVIGFIGHLTDNFQLHFTDHYKYYTKTSVLSHNPHSVAG